MAGKRKFNFQNHHKRPRPPNSLPYLAKAKAKKNEDICIDILENILSRLPVKSLLRFKSVSKRWNSVISSPHFARYHLSQSICSDHINILGFLFGYVDGSPTFFWRKKTNIRSIDQDLQGYYLNFPGPDLYERYDDDNVYGPNYKILCACDTVTYESKDILGSCDGLILLKSSLIQNSSCSCNKNGSNMCILNPSTGTRSYFSCKYDIIINVTTFGLCYDASNDDYKFVLTINNHSYAVYSYKNDLWVVKEDDSIEEIWPGSGCYVEGALHWVAYERSIDKEDQLKQLFNKSHDSTSWNHDYLTYYEYGICYFDPKDDKFKKLAKPTSVFINFKFRLCNLGGKLCLYRNTNDHSKMAEIWMMKKYGDCNSWIKFVTIHAKVSHIYYYEQSFCVGVEPICLTDEGHVVLGIYSRVLGITNTGPMICSNIIIYDPKHRRFDGRNKVQPKLIYYDSLVCPSRRIEAL